MLRNEMSHEPVSYSATSISQYIDHVIAVLLFTLQVHDNRTAIVFWLSPYRSYLEWAAVKLDPEYTHYIPLQASLQWAPSSEELSPVRGMTSTTPPRGPLSLASALDAVGKLVCIGPGGSGKSKTIRALAAQKASESTTPTAIPSVPIYLPAYSLIGATVKEAIAKILVDVDISEIEHGLSVGRYIVCIDALNEVSSHDLQRVIQTINGFIHSYPLCSLIATTRREAYHNQLRLPVYELQPLTANEVRLLLLMYSSNAEHGERLFLRIASDSRLLALFRTPLLSRLVCTLPAHIVIPRSIGEMMATLFARLFERERQKGDIVVRQFVVDLVLCAIATELLRISGNVLQESDLASICGDITRRYDQDISPARLIHQLIQLGIFQRSPDGYLSFFHEAALDYYLALSCRESWNHDSAHNAVPPTSTATEILAGLLPSADALIMALIESNLFLAARCYGARSQRSSEICAILLDNATRIIRDLESTELELAVQALAAIDDRQATARFFEALPWIPTEFLNLAASTLVRFAPAGVEQEVLRALYQGHSAEQEIALFYAARSRLYEAVPLIVRLAEGPDAAIAKMAAESLGQLGTAEVIAYVQAHLELDVASRRLALDALIGALSPTDGALLWSALMKETDRNVRRVAVAKAAQLSSQLFEQMLDRLEHDDDFIVRLTVAEWALTHTATDHSLLVKQVFFATLAHDCTPPVQLLLRFISRLSTGAVREALIQALCIDHRAIQSIVGSRILKMSATIALDAFDLIELSDETVAAGPRIALVEAAIRHGRAVHEVLRKSFATGVRSSIRLAAAKTTSEVYPLLIRDVLPYVLSDSDRQLRAFAAKLVASQPDIATEAEIETLLSDADDFVRKAALKIFASHATSEVLLLKYLGSSYSVEMRLAAIEALVRRRFHFPFTIAHELAMDFHKSIRKYGYRILAAIDRDNPRSLGLIHTFDSERGFGFIYPCDGGPKRFVHVSDFVGNYAFRKGDLVQYDGDSGPRGPVARRVQLLSAVGAKPSDAATRSGSG